MFRLDDIRGCRQVTKREKRTQQGRRARPFCVLNGLSVVRASSLE
jgi:hypothetical protein